MDGNRIPALVVAFLVVLAAASAAPVAAAPGDRVTYGADSVPSWHVTVDKGELDTLESWANSSDDRALLRTHNESNYALVKAPEAAAGQDLLGRVVDHGLAAKSYVSAIRPNLEHGYAEPVTLENASAIDPPGGLVASVAGIRGGSYAEDGIAFGEDVSESLPRDVRDVLGVDNVSATGAGATVAVIDTGVNTADGQVFGNGTSNSSLRLLDASKDFIENETVSDNGTDAVADPEGHGTWVASATAANHSNDAFDGVAPDADVLALRALNADGSGSTGDIAAAIRYAADQDADVIQMSLGSPVYDAALTDAIEYAVEQNVSAITIAAGNSRMTTRWLASPADAPVEGVTAVSASNTSANATSEVAYFANVGGDPGATDGSLGATAGEQVDVAAPGMEITVKAPSTSGSIANSTLSGTSMAAPQVAGIAALGIDSGASWTEDAAAFNERLRETARPIPNAAIAETGQGLAAADRLLDEETAGSQADAMRDAAAARDAYWRSHAAWTDRLTIETLDRVLG
jgi:subtilisin family serine protease